MPLVRRTRATLRRAEFGFLGVVVYTRVHTPRRWGEPLSAGVLVLSTLSWRPLRTSWLIVGNLFSVRRRNVLRLRAPPSGTPWSYRRLRPPRSGVSKTALSPALSTHDPCGSGVDCPARGGCWSGAFSVAVFQRGMSEAHLRHSVQRYRLHRTPPNRLPRDSQREGAARR